MRQGGPATLEELSNFVVAPLRRGAGLGSARQLGAVVMPSYRHLATAHGRRDKGPGI